MAYPHGEEGPGHVRKLPQDVGSTRLVPSSTLRKRKKSDQESNKVDAMREYQRNYYEMNKEEILKKKKKYLLKIKEKRKEVSCDVIFDIINYLFVLTYLNFELSGCQF